MKDIPLNERIILALDVDSPAKAREIVLQTESHINFYKVGLQLFLAGGFDIVDWIVGQGHKLMLDLKFHDIPATVKLAVEQLNGRGITFATIHGHDPVMRAAVAARGDLKLLAVTVLTSMSEADLQAVGLNKNLAELVSYRGRQAKELGCDGLVASGHEAAALRKELGEDIFIITPGIRPGARELAGKDDQSRVMTPGQALAAGADYLVVGRPITRAVDPLAVIEALQEEIRQALTTA